MKAVIDRFEAEFAVLIAGEDEHQLIVLRSLLPQGAKEGQWLLLDVVGGEVRNVTCDDKETGAAKQRITDKLAALRRGDQLK
jgi:hypothetical protein